MPVVFSPGEPETRPLDPDAIVYTSAQKVADLLGVGPSEAVLASANSVDDGVYVTGSDFRTHGFSVGDTILIYSDSSALGDERVITAITDGGASGVKLAFDSDTVDFVEATFTTALNTYVQNTASFTNGKTRGMTRAIVEHRIKEVQDRIDNITHNAWRPYLVSAEYINFDTYKPYRRRYFTDYVGTTPLLFRNVQQILRLELWQGDDYREIAGAEVRLEVVDHSLLSTYSIYMCPGGGGFAKLSVGTGTQQWDASFNKVTTAQNLADLINKEDRTNRGAISFSSSFTVGGGAYNNDPTITHTSSTALKVGMDVFGDGIPAGATIASITDATHFELSVSTTGGNKTGQTLTFYEGPSGDSYTQPDGSSTTGTKSVNLHNEFIATSNADYGNGKLKVSSMQSSKGGEESSMVIYDTTGANSAITSTGNEISVQGTYDNSGTPYFAISSSADFAEYGVIKVKGAGQFSTVMSYTSKVEAGGSVALSGLSILDTGTSGATLVNGNSYTLSQTRFKLSLQGGTGDQARLKDWWLDSEMGIIYFNNSYPFFEWNAVKVSYIYGERYLEKAIEEAATKMVASELLMSDDRSVLIPEGGQNIDLGSKAQLWRKESMEILNRYKEVVVFS